MNLVAGMHYHSSRMHDLLIELGQKVLLNSTTISTMLRDIGLTRK